MHVAHRTLERAARGDQAAFADIVDAHGGMVFGVARRFLRDPALAEEVSQEIFLELFRNLGTIESPEHLTFWLRRVTGNRCIDWSRRSAVRPTVGLEDVPELAVDLAPNDPLLGRALERLIEALPETPRLVLVMRYQEDLDPVEIARVLEMPVNTVKSHLRRSLALLRARLTRNLGVVSA